MLQEAFKEDRFAGRPENSLHVFWPARKAIILESLLEHLKVTDYNRQLSAHLEPDNVAPPPSPLLEGGLEVDTNTEEASNDGKAPRSIREVFWLLVFGCVDKE